MLGGVEGGFDGGGGFTLDTELFFYFLVACLAHRHGLDRRADVRDPRSRLHRLVEAPVVVGTEEVAVALDSSVRVDWRGELGPVVAGPSYVDDQQPTARTQHPYQFRQNCFRVGHKFQRLQRCHHVEGVVVDGVGANGADHDDDRREHDQERQCEQAEHGNGDEIRQLGEALKKAATSPAYNANQDSLEELVEAIREVSPKLAEQAEEQLLREVRVAPTLVKYADPSAYEMETRRALRQAAS